MDTKEKFDLHITLEKNATAINVLAENCSFSKQQLKSIMQKGAVWLTHKNSTQRLRRAKKELLAGETLHLYYDSQVIDAEPEDAKLIADETAYSIWFKPYGMYSQGSKWGDHCTLYRWAEQYLEPQRAAFIVHRLDRAASGLMILAHQKKVAAQFSKAFQQREIHKKYRVIVEGVFPQKSLSCDLSLDGKSAVSSFSVDKIDKIKQRTTLDVSIETGRKHQIRRHLSSLGFPVVGDRLYGSETQQENLQLLAYSIEFICPMSGLKKHYLSAD